ncbi:branched-chain amino acid aminotransferase [Bacillus sp. V3-13]|uniref:branched-chain amino acid aminotransferase n=1 Tax=Bacillus sp. V3-13 TaxID=2053728 RepID=UPI000C77EF9E|nr:branched-chain amino acid aminotransferase [Bacillus sp. V3-13]PLR78710.1 branched-chain amino acid aminotransferase [Bacillus sp. V3-13]
MSGKIESRFADAYIERCDKESEQVIAAETPAFLERPIAYLEKHKNEFIYLESDWFDKIGIDAVSLEVDDVFGTYDTMVGLKLKKAAEARIKAYLNQELNGEEPKYDLMFDHAEGLWNLNFTLNYVNDFNEELSIGEAYNLIYLFLFKLVEAADHECSAELK